MKTSIRVIRYAITKISEFFLKNTDNAKNIDDTARLIISAFFILAAFERKYAATLIAASDGVSPYIKDEYNKNGMLIIVKSKNAAEIFSLSQISFTVLNPNTIVMQFKTQ